MKINRVKGVGCHYLDENNIVLSCDTQSQGIGDSLGRTAIAAVVYDEDRSDLIEGLSSNFRYIRTSPETGWHYYISRYPVGEEWAAVGSSRDHVVYALSSLIMLKSIIPKMVIPELSKRPCIDHPYTIDQKIWFKAVDKVWASNLLSGLMVPYLKVVQGLKWTWRKLGGNGDKILPTFALFYFLWSIQVIKGKWAKKVLKTALLPQFEPTNYVARMLCNDYVTKAEVDGYVPSRKNRWTTRIDKEGNRDMTPYPDDTPENNLELGLLYYLYENQSKEGTS